MVLSNLGDYHIWTGMQIRLLIEQLTRKNLHATLAILVQNPLLNILFLPRKPAS